MIIGLQWYKNIRIKVVNYFQTHQISTINNQKNDFLSYYSDDLINMVLAVEDQRFFQHKGIDMAEIFSAIKVFLLTQKPLRGASTISQQLIKNTLLTSERTLKRKLLETTMTFILENNFSKEFILANYMNRVYLGRDNTYDIYGFKYGSYYYFKKIPSAMTLDEMAQLVAMLKGASHYHPVKYPIRLEMRKKLVLKIFHQYNHYYAKYTSH